ncbi:MAG: polysaccharide deacetylase family protein [Prevotella sp.]|nr:polysaccharide deacetylase family protein [Prevotella sp.]
MNVTIVTSEIGQNGGGMSLSCSHLYEIISAEHIVRVLRSDEFNIVTAKGGYSTELTKGIQCEYKLKEDLVEYENTDIVIGFGAKFNGYYSSLLAERLGVPFILCLRGTDVNISKWSVSDSCLLGEASRKAYKIVCLSNEMILNVCSILPGAANKCIIIPNEIYDGRPNVILKNIPDSIILGTAASHLNEKKGVANLLFMIKEFKSLSDIPIQLQLVGSIDDDLLKEYIAISQKVGVFDNVSFLGYKTREALQETMKKWDFYIQGSVCEGHPNSVIESLLCGTGFISSKTGYIAELLEKDFPVLFFDSWSPPKMARHMVKLIKTDNLSVLYSKAFDKLYSSCNRKLVIKQWKSLLMKPDTVYPAPILENIISLGLHDVQGEVHDSITTPKSVFSKFVDFIYCNGMRLCSMRDYLALNKEQRRNMIVCTFDDGYMSLVKTALPILSKYNFTATVFICTGLIGKDNSWNNKDGKIREHLNEEGISSLLNSNWEIASHGVTHRNLLKLTDKEVEEELFLSKKYIDSHYGETDTYAFPYGAYNPYIQSCVKKYYKYAFSVTQGGTSIIADALQIRRYSISDIYKMIESAK